MLKKLRKKKTAKRIWIILTVLILPAFLFWGFGSFIRSKQETTYAGKIFGRRISLSEYKDSVDAVRNQAIIQFGDNISEIGKKLNLESMAWDRLVLLSEAKKLKVNVSDEEVIALIESYPFFQRKGKFDNQIYSQMLQYVFHSQPRVFEEQIRQSLVLSKLYKEITRSVDVDDNGIKKEYQKLNEEISISYIAGAPSDFTKDLNPQEKEIKDYFAKNSFQFKEPLSFNIEYAAIGSDDKNETAVKEIIKGLALRLNRKEDFAKAAADLKLQVKETGLFNQTGPIPGIGWSPQILTLISRLRIGEFTPPIYVDKYYYILRLKERKEPYIPEFEVIKDKARDIFIKEASRKIARQKIEDCFSQLKSARSANPKSIDFPRIAKACGLKSDSTGLFKFGSYIEGIGASDNFFVVAQDLKEDDFSQIIEMPSGFYIIRLKSKTPIDEKKFLDEKAEFGKKLLLQKKEEYFNLFLQGLKNKA